MTDVTGEVHNLTTEQQFPAGVYRVDFDTKAYWKAQGSTPFHETTDVSMTIQEYLGIIIIKKETIWRVH